MTLGALLPGPLRLVGLPSLLGALCLAGCGAAPPPAPVPPPAPEPEPAPEPAEPAPPPVPPPAIVLRVHADGAGWALALENHDRDIVRLAPQVDVEGPDGARIALRADCESEAPACVELAPGAVLLPPPWPGLLGDAQCACERCASAREGSYRFVLRTCDGAHRLESPPFELEPR